MRQVFYIEADEEMISVIGRIRRSQASELVLVVPYRALVLQSIVNLRLLSHDARKNGKEIIVVTQDDQSRLLCEKAGVRTQDSLDEDDEYESDIDSSPSQASHQSAQQNTVRHHPAEVTPQERFSGVQFPYSNALGSDDFSGTHSIDSFAPHHSQNTTQFQSHTPAYQTPHEISHIEPPKKLYGDIRHVAVRDQNPKKLTTLNSHRFEEEKSMMQQKSFTPPSLRGAQPVRPLFMPSVEAYHEHDGSVGDRLYHASGHDAHEYERNDDVMEYRDSAPAQKKIAPRGKKSAVVATKNIYPKKREELHTEVSDSGGMHLFFIFFGVVCVLSIASVFAYMFLPKADVTVKMKAVSQKSDFEYNGSTQATSASAESRTIPVKIIEKDQDIIRTFDATGKTSLADQKSRGTVTLYNNYSADRQTLVATTRLQSPEGKIFRLVNAVIVPGKKSDTEPGMIEASVIADQSGADFNIAATTFSIPGFAGSPKQDKFSAKSSQAMVGGGVSGSDVTAVSEQDIAKAKKIIEADLKKTAADALQSSAEGGDKILSESIEVNVISSSFSPQIGATASTFELRSKIHIKAFVFSETELKKMTATLFAQKNIAKGPTLTPDMIDIQYGEPTEDFANGTLRITAHAIAHYDSELDQEQLKADLLGQNADDIALLLQKYTQVDSISISLWPDMIISKIPNRAGRVNVIVEQTDSK